MGEAIDYVDLIKHTHNPITRPNNCGSRRRILSQPTVQPEQCLVGELGEPTHSTRPAIRTRLSISFAL